MKPKNLNSSNPLSAYLHIPFCERKCIYCDFYSIENLSLRKDFVALLLKEIDLKLEAYPSVGQRELTTIFFGGGTPSLLEPKELEQIINSLSKHFRIASDVEFTLECNPGTVSEEKLKGYKSLGVNRLSFGVQSFDAYELEWLGRIHNANDAKEAIRLARKAGFDNVSLDLIFSLPSQKEETLRNSLREAIALETNHISAYNLIVEPGTPLFRLVQLNKVIELEPDRAATLFELTQETLKQAGFAQYEISNYAKSPDKRAKHNLVYWDGFADYVSFGPSAHEFLGGERSWNVSSLEQYRKFVADGKLPRLNSERPDKDERRTEILYLGLRSTGVRLAQFKNFFGEDLLLNPEVRALVGDGMLEIEIDTLKLTTQGYRFCDGVVMRLLERAEIGA